MNGNTIAANIYFDNNVTYTGTAGSETNPYCIEDFWDLVLASSYSATLNPFNLNHENRYALFVKDIDMNDYPDITTQIMNGTVTYKYATYTFTFTSFLLRWKQIDGNGYCLRNLCVYGNTFGINEGIFCMYSTTSYSITLKIKNLDIINFISYSNNSLFSASGGTTTLTFEKCNFGVYYYNLTNGFIVSLINSKYIYYSKFEKCTFNFKGSCYHTALLGNPDCSTKPTFNLCHINIDKMNSMGCLFHCRSSTDYITYGGTYFTYITGRMRNVVTTTDTAAANNLLLINSNLSEYTAYFFNKFIMNYINVKLEYDKTATPGVVRIISTTTIYPSPAPNVINETNLIDGAYPLFYNKGDNTNIRHITDTQLKDPVFLNSIGFSVYDSN